MLVVRRVGRIYLSGAVIRQKRSERLVEQGCIGQHRQRVACISQELLVDGRANTGSCHATSMPYQCHRFNGHAFKVGTLPHRPGWVAAADGRRTGRGAHRAGRNARTTPEGISGVQASRARRPSRSPRHSRTTPTPGLRFPRCLRLSLALALRSRVLQGRRRLGARCKAISQISPQSDCRGHGTRPCSRRHHSRADCQAQRTTHL